MNSETERRVFELLSKWKGLDSLKELFLRELNYEPAMSSLSRAEWTESTRSLLADSPLLFAEAGATSEFHVFYLRLASERPRVTHERVIVDRLLREFPYGLFVFSDNRQKLWHFVNVRDGAHKDEDSRTKRRRILRRIAVGGPGERVRTAAERIAMLDAEQFISASPLEIQSRHDKAFNVEAVTDQFFEDYKNVFFRIQGILANEAGDRIWAHDYALQFLNRLMFLYFIQRKLWLGNDPNFIKIFWEAYRWSKQPSNSFFQKWLSVLFFEAFNGRFDKDHREHQHIPEDMRDILSHAPFLNGGLFTKNDLDKRYSFTVPDEAFEYLFDRYEGHDVGFLERYNFTVSEDTPFDQEVAVDPEMIGKVYEKLVNITFQGIEEQNQQGSAGIFYTPRIEIDLMCRLALVDWLSGQTGNVEKELLYQLVFAYEPEEKQEVDEQIAESNLWSELDRFIKQVTVLDPACGSGSFLVNMLLILDDLQARAGKQFGTSETPYQRRKRIIGQSLYGVDIMPWAVHVAELRLWLQLVVETDLGMAELWGHPLLPNLSFKVRSGDSLVQEIGGINLGLHRKHLGISHQLQERITQLKQTKLRFYSAEYPTLSEETLREEEFCLFKDILEKKKRDINEEVKRLTRQANSSESQQMGLDGIVEEEPRQLNLDRQKWIIQREERRSQSARIDGTLEVLGEGKRLPFVWDIAFVEIFEGDKKGFDIVVGNPPYVRQEKIAPPALREDDYEPDAWRKRKKEYKAKLQRSVAIAYPRFFRYRPGSESYRKVDAKSDYYVYFYLHGLSLLNDRGSFCFITSNSWLDVGYGKDLQDFMLQQSHVKMILDNRVKRSFAQADVNTIIVLLGAPKDGERSGLKETARFVMFGVPYEKILDPVIFLEIEETTGTSKRPEFRCIAKSQRALYEEGLESPGDEKTKLVLARKYSGNKWGGKYLRAPDIFFTILEKGKGKLVRLGDIADVRFGIKTGANEFFYLEPVDYRPVCALCKQVHESRELMPVRNRAGWEGYLEAEFLEPIVKSFKEIRTVFVELNNLRNRVFMCHENKTSLERSGKTHALAYIRWGGQQHYDDRPTCRSRPRWWDLGKREGAPAVVSAKIGDRYLVPFNLHMFLEDKVLYGVHPHIDVEELQRLQRVQLLCALLNWQFTRLWVDLTSRQLTGAQAIADVDVNVWKNAIILDPSVIARSEKLRILEGFHSMAQRKIKSVFEELGFEKPNRDCSNIDMDDLCLDRVLPDRRALDKAIFEVLELTEDDQLAMYRAVVQLVKNRLIKARSV